MLFQRSGKLRPVRLANGPMLRNFVDAISIIAICVHPDLDSTIYADKGAQGFQPVPDTSS
jgi:hypothetical protein